MLKKKRRTQVTTSGSRAILPDDLGCSSLQSVNGRGASNLNIGPSGRREVFLVFFLKSAGVNCPRIYPYSNSPHDIPKKWGGMSLCTPRVHKKRLTMKGSDPSVFLTGLVKPNVKSP